MTFIIGSGAELQTAFEQALLHIWPWQGHARMAGVATALRFGSPAPTATYRGLTMAIPYLTRGQTEVWTGFLHKYTVWCLGPPHDAPVLTKQMLTCAANPRTKAKTENPIKRAQPQLRVPRRTRDCCGFQSKIQLATNSTKLCALPGKK